jgi:hypothetical protein
MSTPESKVKMQGIKMMRRYQNVYYHMPVMNGMGAPTLDFIITCNGYALAVETKAPGKKATPRQLVTIAAMEAAGTWCFVVDSSQGWDAVEATMCLLGAIPHDETKTQTAHNGRKKVSGLLQRPEIDTEGGSEV